MKEKFVVTCVHAVSGGEKEDCCHYSSFRNVMYCPVVYTFEEEVCCPSLYSLRYYIYIYND